MIPEQQNKAMCAHLNVLWTTEDDGSGLTRGWWECRDCGSLFIPDRIANSPNPIDEAHDYVEELEAELAAANKRIGSLKKVLARTAEVDGGNKPNYCAVCYVQSPDHADDCEVKLALESSDD